jgi:uncharacterized membrane protein YjfL (UPF0719 family)
MKKNFLILLLISFVFAQDLGFPSEKLPPTINCGKDFFACLGFFFKRILNVVTVLALVLTTIFIAWAGILYITKGGKKEEEIRKIHQMLVWAGVGFIVAFMSFAFVKMLEFWLKNIEKNVYILKFALAQEIRPEEAPTQLRCGNVSIPSVLERSEIPPNVWKRCIIFYATRGLSALYVVSLMIGVIFLALAGILYITHPQKSNEIHKRLIWGVSGIIISILSFTIVRMVELFFTKIK